MGCKSSEEERTGSLTAGQVAYYLLFISVIHACRWSMSFRRKQFSINASTHLLCISLAHFKVNLTILGS